MKKVLALIVVMVMVIIGCTAINQFLCKPTAAQAEAGQVGLALAQAALTAAATWVGGSVIAGALANQAIPVFQKVVQGYCVAQAEWDTAVSTVSQAQAAAKNRAVDPALIMLGAVKWNY